MENNGKGIINLIKEVEYCDDYGMSMERFKNLYCGSWDCGVPDSEVVIYDRSSGKEVKDNVIKDDDFLNNKKF